MEGVSRDPRSSGARLPRTHSSSPLCSSTRHTSRPRSPVPPEGGGGAAGGGGARPLDWHGDLLLEEGEDHAEVAEEQKVVVTVCDSVRTLKLVSSYLPHRSHIGAGMFTF